jgi:hypothetical protein
MWLISDSSIKTPGLAHKARRPLPCPGVIVQIRGQPTQLFKTCAQIATFIRLMPGHKLKGNDLPAVAIVIEAREQAAVSGWDWPGCLQYRLLAQRVYPAEFGLYFSKTMVTGSVNPSHQWLGAQRIVRTESSILGYA